MFDDDFFEVRDNVVATRHQDFVADRDVETLDVRHVVQNVIDCTTAPTSSTGATVAMGVTRPVGPVSHSIASTVEIFAIDANLYATAPRGRPPSSPSKFSERTSLARITSPSIS